MFQLLLSALANWPANHEDRLMFLNSVLKSKKYSYLFNFPTIYLVKIVQNGEKNNEMTKPPANVFSKEYVFTHI